MFPGGYNGVLEHIEEPCSRIIDFRCWTLTPSGQVRFRWLCRYHLEWIIEDNPNYQMYDSIFSIEDMPMQI